MQETGKELASLRAEVAALKESLRACPAADAGRVGDQVARLAERVEALERAITRYVGPVAVAGVLLAMGLSVGPRVVAALLGAGAP
jgi:ABC-type transport system involved in cytochrome bd biosynthesis fused ATPase/permease subunit